MYSPGDVVIVSHLFIEHLYLISTRSDVLKSQLFTILLFVTCQLLDVLESYCMAEGLDYSRLDGTTKSKERVQIVKEFNTSSHINLCLVSTM